MKFYNPFKKTIKIKNKGKNNILSLPENIACPHPHILVNGSFCTLEIDENFKCTGRLDISINGQNNRLKIGKNFNCIGDLNIILSGTNSLIELKDDIYIGQKLLINCCAETDNTKVTIGAKTGFQSTQISCTETNSSVTIGDNCMLSYNTSINNSDGHTVFDIQTRQCLNQAKDLLIGNHVWIGNNATVCKNSLIGNDNIIAQHSLVTGKFPENNCVIAGIPAKIKKTGTNWRHDLPGTISSC